mmetsp:Transcript_24637/g.61537  ORF Transcript_24637/g.61537 Transcript_24637/m.61537 type:complete len:503 (+) Transcript_24637:214-1722(+)
MSDSTEVAAAADALATAKVTDESSPVADESTTVADSSPAEPPAAETSKPKVEWADVDDDDDDEATPAAKPAEKTTAPGDAHHGIDPADRQATVEVLQNDPSTPYFSASTFEELGFKEELLKGIYAMKFNKPSQIQASSLPMIVGDRATNLIGQGHNGSGKTACFVLGMLSRVDTTKKEIQALCVVPTRELARQIKDVVLTMGKFTGVSVYLAVKQSDEERAKVGRLQGLIEDHVVVGTPGKILELLKYRHIMGRTVKIFVLDEADQMVDTQGMGDQTLRIKKTLDKDVLTILFSATYADAVRELALKLAPNANQITIKREQLSLDSIKQYYFDCRGGDRNRRFEVLSEIYAYLTIGQSIIFVRTRRDASELTEKMRAEGHTVSLLFGGDMLPEERDRVIDEFRQGTTKVLITTNVLARGVDVLQVTVVINYDMPTTGDRAPDPETYLHRIGRTGRFGRRGIAINFIHDEESRYTLEAIEKYYGHKATKVNDVEDLEKRIEAL